MQRGEIWTLRDDRYAAKARPVVVVQGDLDQFDSVVLCLLTSFERPDAERVQVDPAPDNGLHKTSYVMADKLVTVRQDELGNRVGSLTAEQMRAVSRQLARVLALSKDDLD
ncbi:type II toxin-antitoxin system PemK/MazF family toxin [Microbacterium sp.]|uniref:type II toxin-antitoxin system PemK/MazF family toxin n=1 Tax=Microbacterium sp. TaxID=51671 RepID=UPI003C79297F